MVVMVVGDHFRPDIIDDSVLVNVVCSLVIVEVESEVVEKLVEGVRVEAAEEEVVVVIVFIVVVVVLLVSIKCGLEIDVSGVL